MTNACDVEFYYDIVIKEKLYSNKGNLRFHLDTLFHGIDFVDKTVLEIGGGAGLLSFFAAFKGAKKVICLEPEAAGSSSKVTAKYNRLKQALKCDNVELEGQTLQTLETKEKKFDIVILYNSINHLDEAACINLLRNPEAKIVYKEIFNKLYSLANKGAKLIVCDCSRYNFFNLLGLRNPVARTIEWHKHQAPETWVSVLTEAGFVNPRIKWTSFNTLRTFGRILTGNKWVQYFLTSHFRLTMDK